MTDYDEQTKFLVEFCKHWDDVSTKKESVFIPVSFLGLVAIAPRWDVVPAFVVFMVGVASVTVYAYQLYILHLTGLHQASAWKLLKAGPLKDVASIVREAQPAGILRPPRAGREMLRRAVALVRGDVSLSVRQVRHGLLLVLGSVWWALTAFRMHEEYEAIPARCYWLPGVIFEILPVICLLYVQRDMYRSALRDAELRPDAMKRIDPKKPQDG